MTQQQQQPQAQERGRLQQAATVFITACAMDKGKERQDRLD